MTGLLDYLPSFGGLFSAPQQATGLLSGPGGRDRLDELRERRGGNLGNITREEFDRAMANPFMGAMVAGGKVPQVLAKKGTYIYDSPLVQQRPFEADYPHGAQAGPAGLLTADRDGRPLTAPLVAGRREVGGADQGVSGEDVAGLVASLTGRGHDQTADPRIIGKDAGRYIVGRGENGPERWIAIHRDLTPAQAPRVLAHEVGHAIDDFATNIPTDGLKDELLKVFNKLNNPSQGGGRPFTPEAAGYKGEQSQRELMAEAIRAYMTNPNYLKTAAPNTAARIREYVNANPRLSSVIQFNSLLGAGLLGGGLVQNED
jgi:hypothetical protein